MSEQLDNLLCLQRELKPGDLVELKSGGPRMTVSSVQAYGVECVWFAGDVAHVHPFAAAALVRVNSCGQELRQ